ncbi:MAG: pyruvate synthase subunit beta [Caldilineae bacterium]|nr:pyruvate synthase subunit beta [Chloroflexota bacterium]MCB9176563.1 pyruvate synthase subunit beta [Caldilineae bacterium]
MNEPALGGIAQRAQDRPEPILRPGNTNCGGCGMSIGWQFLSRAVAHEPIQIVIPACCGIVTAGPYPYSAYGAPILASTFASAAAMATGLSQAARLNGEATRVLCWAGDGGTYDIGMATLSAAAERNENILYICYDNEIYGNTGGQRSSATPLGAVTTTTPIGKEVGKKDIVGIMAAHGIAYAASLSLAHPDDAMRKFRHCLDLEGFRFLHILSPCPTGWKSEPADGVQLLRLAVSSGLYPVIEVFDGERTVINVEPSFSYEDLATYFAAQARFKRERYSLEAVAARIQRNWRRLRVQAAASAALAEPLPEPAGAPLAV